MPYSYRSARVAGNKRRYQKSYSSRNNQRKSTQFDARRFIAAANVAAVETYVPLHLFSDFSLHKLLLANLTARGFSQPTPIQDQAIPVALRGSDVLGMAGTGTGKTAAFALPILHTLLSDSDSAAIVIAPTRELAQQIEADCRMLGKSSGLHGALLIGGSSMGIQLRDLRQSPRLVIGTPGRIKDHLQRGTLKLERFNIIVLDEVDRMLDMGFVNDIRTIVNSAASVRQSLFFSATMNPQVRKLVDEIATSPIEIKISTTKASENVQQDVIRYQAGSDKIDRLHDLLIGHEVSKVLIFDETQRSVERLANELQARGFAVDSMHGGKSQGQRQRALSKFKKSETTVLVATDVAARGLDVTDITHVINYSAPKEYDDYIHRVGRAGRAGRMGYAYTFLPG